MYQLINDAKSNVQQYRLSGTIDGVAFSGENNVLRGSFSISDQCSDSSNFDLGYVHIGVLSATFMNVSVTRNDWKGIEIIPIVTIGETDVPLGAWYVDTVDHEGGLHHVKAYNAMERFDALAGFSVGSSGVPYDILSLMCQECHVELGMTQAEVEELPNGNLPFVLTEQGDIETWRDVLYWLTKSLCSFATIDRQGQLVLRTFHSEVDDEIPADVRYTKSSYGDEIMRYTGIYINDNENEIARYYAADPDDGYSLSIGSNPFMQGSEAQRAVYAANILAGLANIEYNFCKVTIPFGIHYDLGDVLRLPDGFGSATNKFCVIQYTWTYGGDYELRSIPVNKKSKSRSDKDIQGLINQVSKDEVASYEVRNTSIIRIGNNETEKLISVRMASNTDTKAIIEIEVNLESIAATPQTEYEVEVDEETGTVTLPFSNIWQDIADTVTQGIVTYLVNSEEADLHPTESWIDGNHVLHLMYILGIFQGITTNFDVYMKATGGSITIQRGGVWLYAQGVGLVGDGKWDGTLRLEDETADWNLIELTFESASDSVTVNTQTPTTITLTDNASEWNLIELTFENASDTVYINMYTETYQVITEDGLDVITEDGLTLYTEGD